MHRLLIGMEMLADMEYKMQVIKKNIKVVENRKKSYADQNIAFKEFHVGEHVDFCINHNKISFRIGHVPHFHHGIASLIISLRGLDQWLTHLHFL